MALTKWTRVFLAVMMILLLAGAASVYAQTTGAHYSITVYQDPG